MKREASDAIEQTGLPASYSTQKDRAQRKPRCQQKQQKRRKRGREARDGVIVAMKQKDEGKSSAEESTGDSRR